MQSEGGVAGIGRRAFLGRMALGAAGLALAGPLQGLACRPGREPRKRRGYGALIDKGELFLPPDFRYRVISRGTEPMTDGRPTPGLFDGMAGFAGPRGATVLIRNHENRRRADEVGVVVPPDRRYDPDPSFNGGCTKLVVSPQRRLLESFAVGGTAVNCAGGAMPWGSWVTCEEMFDDGAVAWHGGVLYETEDRGDDAAFYRFLPARPPRRPGDLARAGGRLQALRIAGQPGADTRAGWPVGRSFRVDWVDIDESEPSKDVVRQEAQSKGAARFERAEGALTANGRDGSRVRLRGSDNELAPALPGWQAVGVRTYGQYCPIARAAELLGERWSTIILRNILVGCQTFNGIAEGAPGLSRGLLSKRLRELERAGVIEIRPKPDGPGSTYEPTQAGRELSEVMLALENWGRKWAELKPEHAHPGVVLWVWANFFLVRDRLPRRRTLVRFEYPTLPGPARRSWLLIERGDAEYCLKYPGGEEELIVVVNDPLAFARWHIGQIEWSDALRSGAIEVKGSPALARALPTWNRHGWAADDPRGRFEPAPHQPAPSSAAAPA